MNKYIIFELIPVLLLLLFSFFLFTFRITEVPPGINGDEGSIGYNAAFIAKSGHDSEGRFLPLFTKSKDSMDWKQPISVYSTVLVFKLLGVSYFNLRLTSFLILLISGITVFFLIREIMGRKYAFYGLIIFLTTPIIMIQSHLALENITPIPFVAMWLLMLSKYFKRKNNLFLLLAGLFLGIGIFSYLGMRLITPVLVFLTIIFILYLNYERKESYIHSVKWFIAGITPFLIILLLSKFYYPGAVLGLYRPYQIDSYQNLLLPFLSSFDPSFLYITGDSTPYHSTGKHGMMLFASLPLFILGLIYIIRKKDPVLLFILITFFLTPLLFGIGSTIHRASRLLAFLPAYIIITVSGFVLISRLKSFFIRKILLATVFLLIFLNFADFLRDYWYKYPERVKAEFSKPAHEMYRELKRVSDQYRLKPLMQYGILGDPKSDAYLFLEQLFFSNGLDSWERSPKIPPKSIILVDSPEFNTNNNENELDIVRIKNLDYYLLINKR